MLAHATRFYASARLGGIFVLGGAVVLRVLLPASEWPWLPPGGVCTALGLAGLAFAWRRRRAPLNVAWRADPAIGVLVAGLAVLLATLQSHEFRLTSDGVDHFVYLRSIWIDRDLDLANDYARVSPRGGSVDPLTPLGRTGNLHPVGPALVWSPLYLVADVLSRLTGRTPDGDNALYRNAAALAGLVSGWLGLVFVYGAARRLAGRGPALIAALGLGFGTFLYWYLAWAPTMAHAPAFATAALVVALTLTPVPGGTRARLWRAAGLGAACGFTALLRWADALVVLVPLAAALPRVWRRDGRRGLVAEGAVFAAAAGLVFAPQMAVWKLLYGSLLTVPQGVGFLGGAVAVSGVLFSPRHGLFAWSPLLYLGLMGLVLHFRRAPALAGGGLLLLAALTRVNAGTADWWGGAAFGGRRFDAALAPLGVGLALACAALARGLARRPLAGSVALVAAVGGWNLLVADAYRAGTWDYSEPVSFEQMGHAAVSRVDRALGSPFSLPGALWEGVVTGRALRDYEALFMERPHSRWSIRMGLDDRLFLEDGWSAPETLDGVTYRTLTGTSAGLVVPLHRPRAYRLAVRAAIVAARGDGARTRGVTTARLRVIVNQRTLGLLDAGPGWSDAEQVLPADCLRTGRNALRLRVVALEGDMQLAVAGATLEPVIP